ncbi:MAG: nitroreductase family protein [Calditrichaeota bacterium]|nr:nitroreductase family protein [Calditrichota bacterium]RQV92868.1 MAG: nitroreductase family protein [bacterium]RQW02619.1 MAG: nitroreductase family protein [Calditrichota bacterium]
MNQQDIFSVIKKRRSVRSFLAEDIPTDHIEKFKEALQWAPSAGNRQPWHFYFILDSTLKNKLVDAAWGQSFIAQAPLVCVVCANPEQSAVRYGSRGRNLYAIQDTAAAVQNLMLLAWSLGYGSCWVGAFDEESVRAVLNLNVHLRPVAIVPVGKAAVLPEPPPRFPLKNIITVLD